MWDEVEGFKSLHHKDGIKNLTGFSSPLGTVSFIATTSSTFSAVPIFPDWDKWTNPGTGVHVLKSSQCH